MDWNIYGHSRHPQVNSARKFLGTHVALHRSGGKSIHEALVENLSNLVDLISTYGSTIMIAESLDTVSITGIAAILVLLAARIVTRKRDARKSFRDQRSVANKRPFSRRVKSQPVLKPCPSCNERLPLSAILCGMCDYNFLAERPGRRQNLLPSPEPMTHEAPEKVASAML